MQQILTVTDVESPSRWRWRLHQGNGRTGVAHQVDLDETATEYEAFENFYEYVRRNRLPHDPAGSEAAIVERVGRWLGSRVFGELKLAGTVRVVLPTEAEFLLSRPLELAHVDGLPLARHGVTLVYELAGAGPVVTKEPVTDRFRLLALFSLPTQVSALALRAERRGLTHTIQQIASRSDKAIELRVLQYGVTRERLRETVAESPGWDMVHLSAHGDHGLLVLENADGTPDVVPTHELVTLLGPTRDRLKLAVLSACNSGAERAATNPETLHTEEIADTPEAPQGVGVHEASGPPVGLARGLVDHLGVGVLAMRYPVTDSFAVALADELYPRLLGAGQPMDEAVGLSAPAAGAAAASGRPAVLLCTPVLLVPPSAVLHVSVPPGRVELDPYAERVAGFPPEPERFVGRTRALISASAALAPDSGRAGVLFMGMAGAGKTACALELAHQHRGRFDKLVWWQAPSQQNPLVQSLKALALTLDSHLDGALGGAMLDAVRSGDALRAFLPRLRAVLREANVLLVLDNLETLLAHDRTWQDPLWELLIDGLIGAGGRTRVVMTSRVAPVGIDATQVLSIATHALSLSESVLLARELPNLSRLLKAAPTTAVPGPNAGRELLRRVLRVVQGHPKLLHLADAAAADRQALAACVAAAEAAGREAPIAAFFTDGTSALQGSQFVAILDAWTSATLNRLPAPSRLLMELLAGLEDDDRYPWLLTQVFSRLWATRHPGREPGPVVDAVAPLQALALIDVDDTTVSAAHPLTPWRVHPAIAAAVRASTPGEVSTGIDEVTGSFLFDLCLTGVHDEQRGTSHGSSVMIATGLASVPYLMRLRRWADVCTMLDLATFWDPSAAVHQQAVAYLQQLRSHELEPEDRLMVEAQYAVGLAGTDPAAALPLLRDVITEARDSGLLRISSGALTYLIDLLCARGDLAEALAVIEAAIEVDRTAGVGPWTRASREGQRLSVLARMNRHREVYQRGVALIEQLDRMDPTVGAGEQVTPWSVREMLLSVVSQAAIETEEWSLAADLMSRTLESMEARRAPEHLVQRTLFHSYVPLLHLKQYAEVKQVLSGCQDFAASSGDVEMLGAVYGARAALAEELDQTEEAMRLVRAALRYNYQSRALDNLVTSHLRLAEFLDRDGRPRNAFDHRLAAAVLCRASGRTERYGEIVAQAATYLQFEGGQGLPADIKELAHRIEAGNGVQLRAVLDELGLDSVASVKLWEGVIDDAEDRSRTMKEENWPTATLHSRHTRVRVKIGPTFSPQEASWRVLCAIANKGQAAVSVTRVRVEGYEASTRWTLHEDLLPDGGGRLPVVIEPGAETLFCIDGERLATAVWDLGDCDCVVTTSDGDELVHQLRGDVGETFKLMCLTDSVRMDGGSIGKVTFPWSGPPDKLLELLSEREMRWRLDLVMSKGQVRKVTGPDGQDRYFVTEEGQELLDTLHARGAAGGGITTRPSGGVRRRTAGAGAPTGGWEDAGPKSGRRPYLWPFVSGMAFAGLVLLVVAYVVGRS